MRRARVFGIAEQAFHGDFALSEFDDFAFGAQCLEFSDFLFQTPLQTRFDQSEVAEGFAVAMLDIALPDERTLFRFGMIEDVFVFQPAAREDTGFESGYAQQTPFEIGDR